MKALHERSGSEAGERPAVHSEEPAVSGLECIGCTAVPMSFEAVSRYDGRFEFWSARSGMAWVVRDPTGPDHESPASRLAGMAALIAAVRGSPMPRPPLATANGTSTRASASPESRSAPPGPPRRGSGSDVQGQERRRYGKLCP